MPKLSSNKEKKLVKELQSLLFKKVKIKHPLKAASYLSLIIRFSGKYLLVVTIWLITISIIMTIYYIYDLPDVDKIWHLKKQQKITILASNKEIINNFGDLYEPDIEFNDLPASLINAVIATEDRRFFDHCGIDLIGLIRASYRNYKAKKIVQGGSTITQQLAKIIYLNPKKNIKRKIQELIFTFYLEYKFSKQQILTFYLNRVYLGAGIFGVNAGAKYYFGKKLKQLNIYESAIIAGLLKAPSKYSPLRDLELAGNRSYQVLSNMLEMNFIKQNIIDEVHNQPVILKLNAMGKQKSLYFSNWVLEQLNFLIPNNQEDLIIKTTLSLDHQQQAESIINQHINQANKLSVNQAALISVKKQGQITAMVGGIDYQKSAFNRATQALRQSGSIFKIYVYLAAFEAGYKPEDLIEDKPINIDGWRPQNYQRKYQGLISLKQAFASSSNTIAVQLTEKIGRAKIIALAKKLGINSPMLPQASIALGSLETNLLELITVFATINNGGYLMIPYGIEEITTSFGKVLYKRKAKSVSLLKPNTVKYIKELLLHAVEVGTAKQAKLDHIQSYAKTGTTQGYRDAWFIGFNQQFTTGIWLGNDNNMVMKKITGGGLPALIWKDFNSKIVPNHKDSKFWNELQQQILQ